MGEFILDCQLGYLMCDCRSYLAERDIIQGAVAQMVERSLSMREVAGSIPASSIFCASQPSEVPRVQFMRHSAIVKAAWPNG